MIKHPRPGRVIAKGLGRLNGTRLVSRPIADEEMIIDERLCARLTEAMRPEVERLAPWMDPSFDGWGLLDRRPV